MEISHGKRARPRKVLLYGTKGIGKSTWANDWPKPLFLNLEDGLDNIDCAKTPWLTTYDQVLAAIGWLIANPQPAQTIVVDSADWLESMIFLVVAAEANRKSIDLIGYNKGYQAAADMFSFINRGLDKLRIEQNKHIVFLAHEKTIKVKQPGIDVYDKYGPALHEETNAVLTEWVDDVLFANYKTFTRTESLGFEKNRAVAVGGTQRIITTRETAAIVAKNRLGKIPDEIGMDFAEFAKWLPRLDFTTPASQPPIAVANGEPLAPTGANIAGAIVNGHNVKSEPKELVQA